MSGLSSWLPSHLIAWPESWQAAGIFASTFILEDVATVGAGFLLGAGTLSWAAAFFAAFLGVWFGDVGLYIFARAVGRPWFERRAAFRRFALRVEQSERWFARRGSAILILSRCVPGARLPTYLAAGFLRLPLGQFLLITGAVSLAWTLAVLALTQAMGPKLLDCLAAFKRGGWSVLIGMAFMLALLHFVRIVARRSTQIEELTLPESRAGIAPASCEPTARPNDLLPALNDLTRRVSAALGRWSRWEFWPPWLFYPPVAVRCAWLAMKYRGLTVATAANPGIFSGGIVGESKAAMLRQLYAVSPQFTAEAELLQGNSPEARLASLREICAQRGFAYPFILKPDVGQRGVGLKLIHSEAQAAEYLWRTPAPLVVQRYAPGPREIGVFYYRFPHQERGQIFAVTEKVFPVLVGDGHSTLAELIWRDPRARYLAKRYLQRLGARHDDILLEGETVKLVEAGNHAQGCVFRDGMHLLTPALAERIDAISRKLPDFFVGRYDIRYAREEDLRAGRDFTIIELNGAAAEATNIYDARNSLWSAYRTLFRQWELVFAIGAANRQRGAEPTKLSALWQAWREYRRHAASYPAAD